MGHDFGSVRVLADRGRNKSTLREEILDSQSESPAEVGSADSGDNNALPTNGGTVAPATLPGTQSGGTNCVVSTGTTTSNVINNEACTKECSASHEQKHAADIGPCCTKAGVAAGKAEKPEDKDAVQTKFDE